MKVKHHSGYTIITGKPAEEAKMIRWIELANCEIMTDESEEDEAAFVVVSKSRHTTQKERQEDFQHAKKMLK